jgi:hypothetical protein
MTEDRFDERLREAARDYHRPPATPRDDMWQAIAARRQRERERLAARPWMRWAAGIAAVLLLGIAIGRWSAQRDTAVPAVAAADDADGDDAAVYRLAATQYLSRTEAFLTGFRADARRGELDSTFATGARDLLMSTRLMLDSPAGLDQRLRGLLEDLELVLAQIAQFRGDDDTQFIYQGLDQRGVLLRLRAAVPAGAATGAQGVL